jgi:hypothetical protein
MFSIMAKAYSRLLTLPENIKTEAVFLVVSDPSMNEL